MESWINRSMAELYAPPVRAPRGGPWSHVGRWLVGCCAVCGGHLCVAACQASRGACVGVGGRAERRPQSACNPGPSIRNCGVWIRQTDFN
jgi:hypothetical protein